MRKLKVRCIKNCEARSAENWNTVIHFLLTKALENCFLFTNPLRNPAENDFILINPLCNPAENDHIFTNPNPNANANRNPPKTKYP